MSKNKIQKLRERLYERLNDNYAHMQPELPIGIEACATALQKLSNDKYMRLEEITLEFFAKMAALVKE